MADSFDSGFPIGVKAPCWHTILQCISLVCYAILRFAKYKGPAVSRIEAHNERTKETYASNPDIKTELSKHEVPIWEKANLTIEEAAAYFGIGQNRLRELTEDEQCKFVLFVGTKRLIKRRLFEQYLEQAYSI